MNMHLRPSRGKRSTAENQNIVLEKGEIFFETPDSGEGKGTGKIKMGDGTTNYTDLPYFMEQKEEYKGTKEYIDSIIDTIPEGSAIDITDDQSSTIKNTINECISSENIDDVVGVSVIKEINTELSNKAAANHNHDSVYQAKGSYAAASHNHDSVYQAKGSYAASSHTHDDRYYTETEVNNLLNGKAASNHNHDSVYQAKGSYAAASHNHSGVYQPVGKYPTHNVNRIDIGYTPSENGYIDEKIILSSNDSYGADHYLLRSYLNDGYKRVYRHTSSGYTLLTTKVGYADSAGSANSVAWGNISGKPSSYNPSSHNHTDLITTTTAAISGVVNGNSDGWKSGGVSAPSGYTFVGVLDHKIEGAGALLLTIAWVWCDGSTLSFTLRNNTDSGINVTCTARLLWRKS